MKKTIYCNLIIATFLMGAVAGCATVKSAAPGADNVVVTKGPISKHCSLKGQVSTTNGMASMNTPYQHSTLLEEEYNRLRTQAHQMGANTVLLSSASVMTEKKHWAYKAQHHEHATHVVTGNAYWCPAIN